MKVLVIDQHEGTRLKIKEIVQEQHPDSTIVFASNGNKAFESVFDESIDIIITSNQLDGLFGANLLQAITRQGNYPRTLLHSTYSEGYMETGGGRRKKICLEEHTGLFDFATFMVKTHDMSNVKAFLLETSPQAAR